MAVGIANLNALLKRATIEDHEEILQACNAILGQTKGNLEVQHAKVIALLKLERYEDALNVFEKSGERFKAHARLEHAYVLYKSGNFDLARGIAKRLDEVRGARHLEAQSSYRIEEFGRAAELYKDLFDTRQAAPQDEESDLRINGSATDTQLEWKRQGHLVPKKGAGREDLEAFETAYNAACSYIARGEFVQGEILLRKAKDLCSSSEDMSDVEKNAELLPIGVQELYVLAALDKAEQAKTLGAGIAIDEIPDHSTRKIAQINRLAAVSQIANPYLGHRIFHSASPLPQTDSLFGYQQTLLLQNEVALDLHASKFTGVARATTKRLSDQKSATTLASVNGISVANAAAHAQNKLGKLGLKSILPLLEKRPHDVGLVLTIIHLYILTNNHGSAITVLETFFKRLDESTAATDQDVRYAPGLVATMVSLYSIQGRKSHIRTELAKAASYWRHKSKSSTSLLRAAGLSLVASSNPEDLGVAGEIFDHLLQKDSEDKFCIAGYVAAYATTGISQVQKTVEQLTPVNRLTDGIDVELLDSAGVPHATSSLALNANKKRPADGSSKSAHKRVRKSRLPKDYDPNKTPDPERWLPLRDRSTYRPKSKKGKQKAAVLAQGGVNEKSADGLNISNSEGVSKPASTVIGIPAKQSKKKKPKR